jgi:hypothetical protein
MSENKPTIRRNGWSIRYAGDGHFFLEYSAGLISELGATYAVTEEIYNAAKDENMSLKDLIEKYDVQSTCKKLYDMREPQKGFRIPNTHTRYSNGDFIATQEGNKYFLEYQLARHGGGSRKFEISKEIYEDARTGKYSTSDLFKKYNLYHLDVPENDVN